MKIVVTNGRFNLHLSANTLDFAITVSKLYSCYATELELDERRVRERILCKEKKNAQEESKKRRKHK